MIGDKREFYFYIMASQRNGTLYKGVTNNLIKRTKQHKEGKGGWFTRRYNVKLLVYYEVTERIIDAIAREKQVKEWKRKWTLELIESMNPEWRDLYEDIVKL